MTDQPKITNHIEFRSNRAGQKRSYIVGTRIRVQDIVQDYETHGLTAEQIAGEYECINLAQVHASLAFYFENQSDIQKAIKEDEEDTLKYSKGYQDGTGSKGSGVTVSS